MPEPVDPNDPEIAYVTLSGYRRDEFLPHVFRTTDLGQTWEPIAGNLPEAPANDLVADPAIPGRLYVATDVGVFYSAGGETWQAPTLVGVAHVGNGGDAGELRGQPDR